jgi:hypothetical protein
MRTRILNHFHTFHPEAQTEHERLAIEEKRLTRELARRGEDDGEPVRRRMSEPPEDLDAALVDVRAKMDEQRAIISSGVVRIVLGALPRGGGRGAFRRLLTEHPPRDGDELDAQLGYNADTFGDALIQKCIVETRALAPDGTSGDPVPNEWDKWADEMSDGQWEEVFTACLALNKDGNPSVFPR